MTSLIQRRHAPAPAPATALAVQNKSSVDSDSDSDPIHVSTESKRTWTGRAGVTFMDLPTEIHVLISKELIYPDALSLKHTSRYFYNWVDTGVRLKVAWLVERRELHLDCPNDRKCNLRTDLEFCRGSVTLLMQRRREHVECESRPGLGCVVYGTPRCAHRRDWAWALRRRMRRQITVELWWVLLAAVPILLGWLWVAELVGWAMV